jgi:hypothetical protein
MPEKQTIERARRDKAQGKSPTTQAGEFVREEIHHVREGKHGARSPKQAIAIGLSKARRAGVDLPPPQEGQASEKTRKSAKRDYARGHGGASARKTLPASIARARRSAPAGGAERGVAPGALAAGSLGGGATRRVRALGGGAQGGPHEGAGASLERRQEGGARARFEGVVVARESPRTTAPAPFDDTREPAMLRARCSGGSARSSWGWWSRRARASRAPRRRGTEGRTGR